MDCISQLPSLLQPKYPHAVVFTYKCPQDTSFRLPKKELMSIKETPLKIILNFDGTSGAWNQTVMTDILIIKIEKRIM